MDYYGFTDGAEGETRTRTTVGRYPLKIVCLPIPPLRHSIYFEFDFSGVPFGTSEPDALEAGIGIVTGVCSTGACCFCSTLIPLITDPVLLLAER